VAVGRPSSTVTLRSGAPTTVETPAGRRPLSVGAPVTLLTRTAGPTADNLARCRPAMASDADPSAPAAAAVDGSPATAWTSAADPATPTALTVRLPGAVTVARAEATWQDARPLAPYRIQVRAAGAWRTVATVPAGGGDLDTVSFAPVMADAVRVRLPATRLGGENPRLAELAVAGADL